MNTKAISAMIQTHKLSCITRRKGNFSCSCGRDQAEIDLAAMQAQIEKQAEYPERLQNAIIELRALISPTLSRSEQERIAGKIEGVKIALFYFEEMTK